MLLDQIDALTAQIGTLTTRIEELIAAIPAAQGVDADGVTGPGQRAPARAQPWPACRRPGWTRSPASGLTAPRSILAEIGLDMTRFPTAGHLVSWAKLSPRTIQSGAKQPLRQDRQGQPLPQRRPRRGRRRGRQDRHLPRRTLPADRQTPRQAQSPGRRRPLHPGHHLAPARRPRRPLPRPRCRLPRQPHRHRQEDPQPHPPAGSTRLHRHPHPSRLTQSQPAVTGQGPLPPTWLR